jgi:peptidyl-prolyl cis-trans isomerase A (cyclophilin A)
MLSMPGSSLARGGFRAQAQYGADPAVFRGKVFRRARRGGGAPAAWRRCSRGIISAPDDPWEEAVAMRGAKALIAAVTAVTSLAWLAPGPQPGPGPSPAAPERFRAAFATSRGEFTIEVVRAWAPHGADRFHGLVAAGFFDDSRFFRVVPGFIAQFGIAGEPRTTAAWRGRTIPDDPVRQSNVRGTIAFAMTGPGTRSTQLYINLSDNVRLDAQGFAPIGRVAGGMDTVDRLYGGYGETAGGGMRGGRQAAMLEGGNAHLDANFPKLDRLLRARLIEERP